MKTINVRKISNILRTINAWILVFNTLRKTPASFDIRCFCNALLKASRDQMISEKEGLELLRSAGIRLYKDL